MATDLERLVVRLEAQLKSYERSMAKAVGIANTTSSKIEGRFNKMNANLNGIGDRFLKGFAVGAVGALFSAQTVNAITDAVAALAAIGDTSERIGITAEKLQELRYAADMAGGSAESLDNGLQKFAQNMSQAASGSGDLAKVLKINGIALYDQDGKLRSVTDMLGSYADLVTRAKNPQDALNLSILAFGRSAGKDMVGLLQQGSAGINQLTRDAQVAGVVVSNSLVAKAGDLDDKLVQLKATLRATFQGFAVEVAPYVVSALEEITLSVKDLSYTLAQLKLGNVANALSPLWDQSNQGKGSRAFKIGASTASPSQSESDAFFDSVRGGRKVLDAGTITKPAVVPPAGYGTDRKNEYERETEAITRRTAALISETAAQASVNPLINDYGFAVEKARAAQDLLYAAQEAGLTITPALREKIDALASGYATASVESQKLAEKQDLVRQRAEEMRDLGRDVFSGFISDMREGKSATEALANALDKVASKLIDIALNDLFGGGSSGSAFGGIGKLLGFASGGYTGDRGTGKVAGVVHGKEFVVNARATAKNRALLEAMNSGLSAVGTAIGVPVLPSAVAPRSASAPIFRLGDTHIDARGSQMSESQFASILAENNKRLMAALPDKIRNMQRDRILK
ncbi:hypothetical protein [Kaistia defluvii]|uniref:Uncharacterized protein YukE n=1 Tax=Kaistia defluvii TaxID=410841 RepID=A0ABV2R4D9_9HYPH